MITLPLQKINDEVFFATDNIVRLDQNAVTFIKDKAINNIKGRARICAHQDPSDSLHEMIIAIRSNSYIRPHRHHNKIESFHLVEGSADIVILDEAGEIEDVIRLDAQHHFYYRLNILRYHTLIIHSPILVIHEITNGPFDIKISDFASYSPMEDDKLGSIQYINDMKQKVIDFNKSG